METYGIQVLLIFILIGVNAFFAASEIAIISMNDNKIRKMAEEGDKKARLLHSLVSEPSRFLATIQVGITLSGLLASAFAAESFADGIVEILVMRGVALDPGLLKLGTVALITLVLSYFTLVFGELVPKRMALQKHEAIAMFSARPLTIILTVARPFVHFLTFSTNFFLRLLGTDPDGDQETVSEEEIKMMVDVGREKGVILTEEQEMIDNIFEFNDTSVGEIMTHRTEISALSVEAGYQEVLEYAIHEKYSRIPVFEETLDRIVGILYVKDLLNHCWNGGSQFSLRQLMRQPCYVPESKKANKLFHEMQQNKFHLAVIIDEYGGTAGIVTIEDLVEEVMGNISDEYDEDEEEILSIQEGVWMVEGTTELDVISDSLDLKFGETDYDTIGGFVISLLGRIPAADEDAVGEYEGYRFRVVEVSDKRIARIEITRCPVAETTVAEER